MMWNIVRNHLKNIILFFFSIAIVSMMSFAIVFDNHVEYIDDQMEHNIDEYDEVDREQLCKIANCTKIVSLELKKSWCLDIKEHIKLIEFHSDNFLELNDILFLNTTNYTIFIYNESSRSFYLLDLSEMLDDYILVVEFFVPLSLFLFMYPLYRSVRKEQEDSLLMIAGNEALLTNKSMISITENIHHELNTPLEVIDNKICKIHGTIEKYLIKEYTDFLDKSDLELTHDEWTNYERREINKELVKLTEDFEFIKTSSEQIYSVLEKMKGFKHLRYSNGNKSIRNIITGGFKIINISNTDFEYKVDTKLSKYGLDGLKNADLLSIMLNHIKNSLEANADKVVILFVSHESDILKFRIIDNGNGIPKELRDNVFKPNFSTKTTDLGVRGNGLYINKHILNNTQGDVEIINSTKHGTTIEISIKVKLK